MIFFVISDTHGSFDFPEITADFILLLGDIDREEIQKIDQFYPQPKFAVFGNSDFSNQFENTSIINIHKKVFNVNGKLISGFGGIPKYSYKNNFFEYEDSEIDEFISNIDNIDIFISHANPMLEFSFDTSDPYRGFNSFIKLIELHQPQFFLHGHLHTPYETRLYPEHKTNIVCVYKTYFFSL